MEAINKRSRQGKGFTILAVAEGAISKEDAALTKKELKAKKKQVMFCDLVTKNIPVSICSHKNTLCLLSPVLLCLCTVRASGMPEHKKSRCYMLYMMFLIDRKNHCTPLQAGLLTYVPRFLTPSRIHVQWYRFRFSESSQIQ